MRQGQPTTSLPVYPWPKYGDGNKTTLPCVWLISDGDVIRAALKAKAFEMDISKAELLSRIILWGLKNAAGGTTRFSLRYEMWDYNWDHSPAPRPRSSVDYYKHSVLGDSTVDDPLTPEQIEAAKKSPLIKMLEAKLTTKEPA
jgi:hypothetical protein